MSSIEKRAATSIMQSKSVSGAAGKAMIVGGGATLAIGGIALMLPIITWWMLALAMVGIGVFIAE